MTTLTKKSDRLFPSLFNDFFEGETFPFPNHWEKQIAKYTPSVNIKENDTTFTLELAAPGLKKEDFKVSIDNNILTIKTEKQEEKNISKEKYNRREFYYNSFSRSFTLPSNVKEDSIKATYKDGLLSLEIPKAGKKDSSKTISIK